MNKLLEPIREIFKDPKLKKLTECAYPPLNKSKLSLKFYIFLNATDVNLMHEINFDFDFLEGKIITAANNEISPALLDIRVGKIVEIEKVSAS